MCQTIFLTESCTSVLPGFISIKRNYISSPLLMQMKPCIKDFSQLIGKSCNEQFEFSPFWYVFRIPIWRLIGELKSPVNFMNLEAELINCYMS